MLRSVMMAPEDGSLDDTYFPVPVNITVHKEQNK